MEYREIAKYVSTSSPDWFQSNVMAVTNWQANNNGGRALVAFSSRSYIHVFIIKQEIYWENQQEYSWSCVGQIIAHQDKISAVTFDECACLRVVSCGLDGLVRRWKYISQEWMLETEFNIQEVRGNINPTAVSCLSCSANESYNFVGTDRGWLLVWVVDCETNKSYYVSKKFENDSVVLCTWEKCAIVQSISRVAVGYKKGIVCVYSFIPSDISSTPSIVQLTRFYAHEADICHIVWRSSASASSSDPEILTCGRDQMVKVSVRQSLQSNFSLISK
ncbi:unnamed protein product [Trichobilharzia szidati]|nr:unnamed protein product [Trichobilharzia szidati]